MAIHEKGPKLKNRVQALMNAIKAFLPLIELVLRMIIMFSQNN
jgi:hypothetical protein